MPAANSDSTFRFVDAHVHFYDMSHPTLYYAHWQPDQDHPSLGSQTRKLGQRNYVAEDFLAESRPHGTVKCVHVQAAIGSKDPVEETKWLQAAHDRAGAPDAIIGYVDLRADDAERQLERHQGFPDFKGVRDFGAGGHLHEDRFAAGLGLLAKRGLVSSIGAGWQEMETILALAKRYPDLTIVLNHAASPAERSAEYHATWKSGLAIGAQAQNVHCKISGLGMADNNWTVASIRPFVETCIELFGCDRAFFATNWPIDSLWSDYATVVDAYREITAAYSAAERGALFARTAERIYGI